MAKNILDLPYDVNELLQKLKEPVYMVHDQKYGLYRIFYDKAIRDEAQEILDRGEALTSDILSNEGFNFIAPAPFIISASFVKDVKYILLGDKRTTIDFTFSTVDGQDNRIHEAVDAFINIKSAQYENSFTKIFASDMENSTTIASVNIDDYLQIGDNYITVTISGHTTGAKRIISATYHVVELSLSSTFDISRPVELNSGITIPYSIKGQYNKSIEVFFDGVAAPSILNISDVELLNVTRTYTNLEVNLPAGRHHLQMRAKMDTGDHVFYSNLLYFEFVVRDSADMNKYILIKKEFPSNTDIFTTNAVPGLAGEQYVTSSLDWAYYTNDVLYRNAVITWKLYNASGEETTLATRTADIVDAEVGAMPTPVNFMPTETGDYSLLAFVGDNNDATSSYTISVIKNTQGVEEVHENLLLKLSGLGRSNDEPTETLSDWSHKNKSTGEVISTEFNGVTWDSNRGWVDDALRLSGGATAVVKLKPFAAERAIHTNNGVTFEIDFETFNVDYDDASLVLIGSMDSAHLLITATGASLTGGDGTVVETKFKSDERVKLCFTVFPNQNTELLRMMFIQNNGIRERGNVYNTAENFNMGRNADLSQLGMIHLGNEDGLAGIKIYSIRVYDTAISMYQEFFHYAIDSGKNLASIIEKNDIYITGTHIIDASKCEEACDTIYFTGPMDELISSSQKKTIRGYMSRRCPYDNTRNFDSPMTTLSTAGQSTLGFPVPSLHVKLDKDGNIATDLDGNPLNKNQYAIRKGGIPEKKFRLQANYMDSSGCHNGALLRMINEVFPKVEIGGKKVLLTPSQKYSMEKYAAEMKEMHGDRLKDYTFPYTIELEPDSMPCVVFWRASETDTYHFLGQYVIMEEKKATRCFGQRSIYPKITDSGKLDPFDLYEGKKGEPLWDNKMCMQFEHVLNETDMALFKSDALWDDINPKTGTLLREESFEMIYPDPDDVYESGEDPIVYWNKFRNFFNSISETYVGSDGIRRTRTKEEFDANWDKHIDKYFMAAYYCIMMRHALVDSPVRNLEWTTFDGEIWLPKYWDADTQLGLRNDGQLVLPPAINRDYIDPNSDNHAFNGYDSWLWTRLEDNEEFMKLVVEMDAALYRAGWNYSRVTEVQDKEYVYKWAEQMFNESGDVKYTKMQLARGGNMIAMLQGARTSHRHNWMRESYDYWDAKHVVGEYQDKVFFFRAPSVPAGNKIKVTSASETYLGWAVDQSIQETGVHVMRGDEYEFTTSIETSPSTSLNIFSANKLDTIDISDFAHAITYLNLEGCADSVTGSSLKNLNIGVPKSSMAVGRFNNQANVNMIGLQQQNRLENVNIQGLRHVTSIGVDALTELHELYAAGSGLTEFNPADGARLNHIELPDTIKSLILKNCKIADNAITFWRDTETVSVPSTLHYIEATGMGADYGTKMFIKEWLNSIANEEDYYDYQLTANNVNWTGMTIDEIMTLCKMKKQGNVYLTGYIQCDVAYTQAQMSEIISAFGESSFTYGASLLFDADSRQVLISGSGDGLTVVGEVIHILKGTSARLTAAGFPIIGVKNYTWEVKVDGEWISADSSHPLIIFDGNTLNGLTGEIHCEENDTHANPSLINKQYYIRCNRDDGISGDVIISVDNRTYPERVDIIGPDNIPVADGVYQFTSRYYYDFRAVHAGTFNGNMKETDGYSWELIDEEGNAVDESIAKFYSKDKDSCSILVVSLPDEYNITLKYTSRWKDGSVYTENAYACILGVTYNVLTKTATGNEPMFTAMEAIGLTHADEGFNSTELKMAPDEIKFKEAIESVEGRNGTEIEKVTSGSHNVLFYLKNTSKFNLGGTGLIDDLDFTKNKRLSMVNTQGTQVSVNLPKNMAVNLDFGAPKKIVLPEGTDSDITLQYASGVEEVSIDNPTRKNAFSILDGILKQIDAEKDYEQIEIEQTPAEMGYDGIGAGTMQLPDFGIDVWTSEGNISVNPNGLVAIPSGEFSSVRVAGVNKAETKIVSKKFGVNIDAYSELAPIIAENPSLAPIIAENPSLAPIIAENPSLAPIIAEWPDVVNSLTETGKRNWLQNDGVAYIDTGFEPNGVPFELDVNIDFEWLGNKPFACIIGASTYGANEYTIGWSGNRRGIGIDNIKYNLNIADYANECHIQTQRGSFAIHDVNQQTTEYLTPSSISYNPGASLYLFAAHRNGVGLFEGSNTRGKFEYVRFYREENEIQHLVPFVRDGEAGMIDLITGTFFSNANTTGSFTIVTEDKND